MVATDTIQKDTKYRIKDYDINAKNGNQISNSSDEESSNFLKKETKLDDEKLKTAKPYKMQLVWTNILAFAGCMRVWSTDYGTFFARKATNQFIFVKFIYALITNMGVTAGAHRLWSHKAYKAKRPLEYVLAVLFVAAGQNDIYEWCRDHRVHHKWSETDADPHNATRGFFFSHIGWLMVRKHPEVIRKGRLIDMSDLENDPMVKFQRKYYKLLHPILVLLLPSLIVMYFCPEVTFPMAMISSIARYQGILHFVWLVNSAAHLWGTRPYNDKINPAESTVAILGTFGFGEGYHNYHHAYPWDYQASEYGFFGQLNLTALVIDIFAYFGWAYDLRKANKHLVEQMKENVLKRKNSVLDETEVEQIINESRSY